MTPRELTVRVGAAVSGYLNGASVERHPREAN